MKIVCLTSTGHFSTLIVSISLSNNGVLLGCFLHKIPFAARRGTQDIKFQQIQWAHPSPSSEHPCLILLQCFLGFLYQSAMVFIYMAFVIMHLSMQEKFCRRKYRNAKYMAGTRYVYQLWCIFSLSIYQRGFQPLYYLVSPQLYLFPSV